MVNNEIQLGVQCNGITSFLNTILMVYLCNSQSLCLYSGPVMALDSVLLNMIQSVTICEMVSPIQYYLKLTTIYIFLGNQCCGMQLF